MLSAYAPPQKPLIEEAPWSITIESALDVRTVVAIQPGTTSGALVRALALLDEPELSTRGLLWLSSDPFKNDEEN